MKRDEFLERLEMLLEDISVEERDEAMAFYRSYFEDAGIGNEEKILQELESPEKVAETIKRELGMVSSSTNSSTHREYSDEEVREHNRNNNLVIAFVIVIAILTSPGWLGMLAGIAGTIFGVVVALVAITFAMLVVGIACFCAGIPMIFSVSAGGGIAIIGLGFLVLALGLLLLVVDILLFGKFVPWVATCITNLCKKLFGKVKEAQTV